MTPTDLAFIAFAFTAGIAVGLLVPDTWRSRLNAATRVRDIAPVLTIGMLGVLALSIIIQILQGLESRDREECRTRYFEDSATYSKVQREAALGVSSATDRILMPGVRTDPAQLEEAVRAYQDARVEQDRIRAETPPVPYTCGGDS